MLCGQRQDEVKCHKVILDLMSPVFSKMLDSGMEEARNGIVKISDLDVESVTPLLKYMYTGKLEASLETIESFS